MTGDLLKRAGIVGELTRVFRSTVNEGDFQKLEGQCDFQFTKEREMVRSVENIGELDYWSME